MSHIFLSHSSSDKKLARRIANALLKAGIEVWLDEWEILVGDSITQRIQHGLDDTDFVAVLLSEKSVESGWVEKEWQSQIGVEAVFKRVVILPLRTDDCQIPTLLRDKRYADFRSRFATAMAEFVAAIKGHATRPSRQVATQQPRILAAKESTDVLIIEDDLMFAHRLCDFLQKSGVSVTIADSMHGAIEMAKRYQPKSIIIDPSWIDSGYFDKGGLSELRAVAPHVRIVGLTKRMHEIEHLLELFDAVLGKPATLDELLEALEVTRTKRT